MLTKRSSNKKEFIYDCVCKSSVLIFCFFSDEANKPPVKLSVEEEEDEPFEPNILNSTVYIISMALQIATFAINYRVRVVFVLYFILIA